MSEIGREYGAVLPCGGRGERLANLTRSLAKPLFKIASKELIAYTVDALDVGCIKHIVFALGYRATDVRNWAEAYGIRQSIDFSEQVESGVTNAILSGASLVPQDSFIACNADEIRSGLKLPAAIRFHESNDSFATMIVTATNRLYRHRLVTLGTNNLVTKTHLKPEDYRTHPSNVGLVNTGMLILDKDGLDYFDSSHSKDWAGIIDPLCESGKLSAYVDEGITYFNVGTPDEFCEAETYLKQNT